jgi:hypothetical protein
MLLVHLHWWLRMRVAVTLCRQTQQKRRGDKNHDALFFRGENELVSQFLPIPTFGKFQRTGSLKRGRTRTDG